MRSFLGQIVLNIFLANFIFTEVKTMRFELKRKLLENYNKEQVPKENEETPVNVTLYMWPYDILRVNEAKSSIKLAGWIDMRWMDVYLKWDPTEHANISHIFLPADQIWLPFVDIYYSKDEGVSPPACTSCYVVVNHTGEILRGFYFSYSFPCNINIKYFPFDRQTCELDLANWYLDDTMMDLHPKDLRVDLSVFLKNEEWDLISMQVNRRRDFFNYGYFASLKYTLVIQRKSFFYICNLVAPSLIITVTAVIGYHMPSSGTGVHQEKVKMGITTILSIFILQLGVSDKMPRTTDVVPLISIYYSCMVMILSCAIVTTSLVIVIEKQGIYGRPLPWWVRRYFLREQIGSLFHSSASYMRLLQCNCSMSSPAFYGGSIATIDFEQSNSAMNGRLNSGYLHSFSDINLKTFNNNNSCSNRHNAYGSVDISNNSATPEQQQPNCNTRLVDGCCMAARNAAASCFANSCSTAGCNRSLRSKSLSGANATACVSLDSLEEDLEKLRKVMGAVENELRDMKEKRSIRAQWTKFADFVEKLMLAAYLLMTCLSVVLFVYHDWY